ncbi:Cyclic nucleotide-binding domain-containing protein [Abditibacterium utsteinense]|uniref:Cyclic nucleotide-binding domain-containing protein n=1 Tax=Abditibacterium utsteinense TaxID=1960156 RepID=A0A2S8SPP4_9BACT|nr:cyclic nucleotide-binding domain-containing protein [Abditibacterium utsteinense]PQV62761.1 Cyclic nucleotide-binding domain-containing protein [Abditibacterium utsteinense]
MTASSGSPVTPALCRRVFGAVPHFSILSEPDCSALAPMLVLRQFAAGSTLFYEDDESDAAYFLLSGSVEIFKSSADSKKLPLLVLREGGLFGEMGLLLDEPRTATARSLDTVQVLSLGRAAFEGSVERGDQATLRLALAFSRLLAQRLSATDAKLFDLFQHDIGDALHEQMQLQTRLLVDWTV